MASFRDLIYDLSDKELDDLEDEVRAERKRRRGQAFLERLMSQAMPVGR